MTPEQLMEAFQYLDDDIIETVDLIRRNPAPVKKTWSKWMAAAACFCLILTGIYAISSYPGGFDGALSEDKVMEENHAADKMDMDGTSEMIYLTLPDYGTIENISTIRLFNFSESNQESTSNQEKDILDGLYCTSDMLPVYYQMKIPSSLFIIDTLAGFEQKLADLTSYEIYSYYPSIAADEAAILLKEGKYVSFIENNNEPSETHAIEMVYLYETTSDLAIPFYHFSDDNTDDENSILKGWFIPAISEEYITNMPDHSIKE